MKIQSPIKIKNCKKCGKEFKGTPKDHVCTDCMNKLWFGTEEARIRKWE